MDLIDQVNTESWRLMTEDNCYVHYTMKEEMWGDISSGKRVRVKIFAHVGLPTLRDPPPQDPKKPS